MNDDDGTALLGCVLALALLVATFAGALVTAWMLAS